jgi:hypothetical protein
MFAIRKYHSYKHVTIFYVVVLPSIILQTVVLTDTTYQPNEHVKCHNIAISHYINDKDSSVRSERRFGEFIALTYLRFESKRLR